MKIVIDAYTGATTFYVFDRAGPDHRRLSRRCFRACSRMLRRCRRRCAQHVRYPELLLAVQAAVYGLYHMTNPDVFYNREDLWTVATEIGTDRAAPAGHASRTSC